MTDLKYGRKPPKNAPALRLGPILTGTVPAAPANVDYGKDSGLAFQMLGNDQYGDCITPETRVLTADLRWVPAGELEPGDALLGYDEEPESSQGRKYRVGHVETSDIIQRPCYELEFDDGTVVRSSAGHKWLARSSVQGELGTQKWVTTEHMKLGPVRTTKVVKSFHVWDTEHSFEAGYLAAAFDGEGNLEQKASTKLRTDGTEYTNYSQRICFSQVDNPMLAEVERCLKELGFDYRHTSQERGGNSCVDGSQRQTIHRLSIGDRSEWLRLLGSVRPARLLPKLDVEHLGRIKGDVVKLVRKTYLGEQDVVYLNTTTRTYFAEGLASHNCVAVTWANQRAVVSTLLTGQTDYPNQAQVFDFYKTQNPGFPSQDDGMDIQTALEYLVSHGGPDGVKAVAFAKVDYTNEAELRAAHAIFGQVWYGVNVLVANMDEFNAGQPWDYVHGSPVDGGHSITGVGYDPADYRFVTWAQETTWTEAFRVHQVEEAWVVIWPEHLGSTEFQTGVDVQLLAEDYHALTGKTLPVPTPPAPTPAPTPTPTPVPPTPAPPVPSHPTVQRDFTQADADLLDQWAAARHSGTNKKAAAAWERGLSNAALTGSGARGGTVYRDATTGEYVTPDYAHQHPDTTVSETI